MRHVFAILLLCAAAPLCLATTSATQTTDSSEKAKVYHDGSLRDLNAIGNRNVGCGRGVGNWYSLEKQIAEGKQYADQVEQKSKLLKDPVVTEYVNRLGQNLVRNSDARVPFTIKVIDSDEVNAFALPGGFFFVNSGLILAASNEAELAGVMAHEIAHVAACHAAREQTRGTLANLASIPLIMVGGGIGYAAYEAMGVAVPATFMAFSRNFESEADFLGTEYLYKAGYDPQALISFFERIEAEQKKKPGFLSKAFATHPQTPDRVEKTQQEISTILPPQPEYVLDTSEFQDVKGRLAALVNHHRLQDNKGEQRPTLRRSSASTDSKSNPDAKSGDDDRPTLKRRTGDGNGS